MLLTGVMPFLVSILHRWCGRIPELDLSVLVSDDYVFRL